MLSLGFHRTAIKGLFTHLPAVRATLASAPRFFATETATVNLACDLHLPPNASQPREGPPIIFMHGLFGSKKNNRSVSKYGLDSPCHGSLHNSSLSHLAVKSVLRSEGNSSP